MTDRELLVRFLEALGPASSEILVIGGWAHRLLCLHPLAVRSGLQPLVTKDVDVLFSGPRTSVDISSRLSAAGFSMRPKPGDERPAVADYVHPAYPGAPIEFLTPEPRSRRPPPPTRDIGGVSASTIKGLDVLLVSPWKVELTGETGYPVAATIEVQLPNPVAYALHKLLVSTQRPDRAKRTKDVLYAFDTLVLFAGRDEELRESAAKVRACLSKSAREKLIEMAAALELPSDTVRAAAEIARESGRSPAPLAEQIGGTLAAGIRRFLATSVRRRA
ncbi:MAG: hypothetical protein HYZ28_24330 [Myxococcales bacterium]|nr:hypothetical protein [Myxococcales bacterium]